MSVTVVSECDTERIIKSHLTAVHLYLSVTQPKPVSMLSLPCLAWGVLTYLHSWREDGGGSDMMLVVVVVGMMVTVTIRSRSDFC